MVLEALHRWFRPLLVALFNPRLSWSIRWRTLLLQPISLITYSINTIPYLFSRPFVVEHLPIAPGRSLRVLVFKAPGHGARSAGNDDDDGQRPEEEEQQQQPQPPPQPLRPLHVEIHGGSFIGGLPESNAAFDARVAAETGAVVVSLSYRYAPEHVFPAAIDDVDAAVSWIAAHAAARWGADPALMTVGGFSAGGNLAVAATQRPERQAPSPTRVRAIVTFYAALDLRLRPDEKPRPAGFPASDPLRVLLPLFDAYMAGARRAHVDDARLSPALARRETLPERILLVVPAVDILFAEQMAFAERVNGEDEREGRRTGGRRRIETMVVDGMFHGYLEVPDAVVKRHVKDEAFTRGVEFLRETKIPPPEANRLPTQYAGFTQSRLLGMPRRYRRQHDDFDPDFAIHVDPSCMSEPTRDDTMEQEVPMADVDVGVADTMEDHIQAAEVPVDVAADAGEESADAVRDLDAVEDDELAAPQADDQEADGQEASNIDNEAREAPVEAVTEDVPTNDSDDELVQEPAQELPVQNLDEDDIRPEPLHASVEDDEIGETAPEHHENHSETPDFTTDNETQDTMTVDHTEQDTASVTDYDQSLLDDDDAGSRRQSAMSAASVDSDRRASYRTEALIHAAARDIVEQLGRRESVPDADTSTVDGSSVAGSERQSYGGESITEHIDEEEKQDNTPEEEEGQDTAEADAAGDSSSHHEHEDEVFSDDSPRSSMGSMSEAEQTKIEQTLSQRNISQRSHSPRISDIPPSDMDDEDFVATVRGTPRPPFRSPSSVRALQMSSPPASVLGTTPRSSRRTPLPTVSRLGSPSVSAQYSPKKTPPRFKRATPPLVLLHVTLLPPRWAWADVLEAAAAGDLSPEAKTLRDAWRQLQERTGDTVSDRGILLPHPQNDYEVLEERLLEALELPLRRRARILDDAGGGDDDYYDDEYSRGADKTHWCRTCKSEIRYDSLGQGRVFRVKVYASNGLMRAGAWEACWKEMERVDVELEPIVDVGVGDELAALAAEQERAMEMRDDTFVEQLPHEPEQGVHDDERQPPSTPAPEPPMAPTPAYHHQERRRTVDEERLREIYGSTPPAHAEAPSETPPSPGASASLPELLLEAGRVAMRDRKNVVIGLLSVLILLLAMRTGVMAPAPVER
ncbi:pathway-specific nitrogen regulator [Purpureocillium lavendulum]|uniref:Pathway-specific nitrogen regulator n=1 Tax=Purpureocillium lavendulum TaxID=1247861 RepID=A0AB34FLV3_9HYPO|nr:pathway-specific nitrogen regulator [Purpureocillium lavendulum]